MAITTDVTFFDDNGAPNYYPQNVASALVAGGNLPAATYYIRICAVGGIQSNGSRADYIELASEGSPEISQVIAPADVVAGNQTIRVTWNALQDNKAANAPYYNIYCSTTSGSYEDTLVTSTAVNRPTTHASGTGAVTHDISDTAKMNKGGMDHWTLSSTYPVPLGLDRSKGRIRIDATGSGTHEDLYNQLVTDGYGNYVAYDSYHFHVLGCMIFRAAGTALNLTFKRVSLFLYGGRFSITSGCHADTTVVFGDVNDNSYGCVVRSESARGQGTYELRHGGCAAYDTVFQRRLLQSRYYFEGTCDLALLNTADDVEIRGCFIDTHLQLKRGLDGFSVIGQLYQTGTTARTMKDIVHRNPDGSSMESMWCSSYFAKGHSYVNLKSYSSNIHIWAPGNVVSTAAWKFYGAQFFDEEGTPTTNNRPTFNLSSNNQSRSFEFYFYFDVVVRDADGDLVSGAAVDLYSQATSTYQWVQGTETTGITGRLTLPIGVLYETGDISAAGALTWTENGPFNVEVYKDGHKKIIMEDVTALTLGGFQPIDSDPLPATVAAIPIELQDDILFDPVGKVYKHIQDKTVLPIVLN